MMSKSKLFLWLSLIFLLANLFYLLYLDDSIYNSDFAYGFYSFEAKVVASDKKLNGWNMTIEPQNLANYTGKIIVYNPLYPEYNYGDILSVSGKIYQPEPIIGEDSKVFAYDQYLAKDGIYGTMYRPKIKWLDRQKDFYFYLFKVKNYFWNNLNTYLREPASSLAKAIFLGARREIPDEVRNTFSQVGLSHIIAISGLHMAIIVWILQSFLLALGFSRQRAFVFLLLILFLYLFLIGFPASALRASLMVSLAMLGPFIGRPGNSFFALVFLADVFVLLNPKILLYDIGFQLSFLAVTGLLFYVKYFQKVLVFIPNLFKFREVLSVTLAAQFFTWPLIVYHFGIFSVIAPLANFLILPLLPAILILSMGLAILGFFPWLASLMAWPVLLLFKWMVLAAQKLSQVPYAYFQVNNFLLDYLVISFIFLIILTYILKPQQYEN